MFEVLLKNIALTLDKKGIPYMIIGGQAVLLYGNPRLTKDIDITLGVDIDRLAAVREVCTEIGLEIIPKDIKAFVAQTYVLPARHRTSTIRIDFIFSFSPYEKQALSRVNKINIQDTLVKFASLEDIIIHKIISARPRDIEDVKSIMTKHPKFDTAYIETWLKAHSKTLETRGCLKAFQDLLY